MNEVLSVMYVVSNLYDHYAIVLNKRLLQPGRITCSVVGHMPKELSRIVYSLLIAM